MKKKVEKYTYMLHVKLNLGLKYILVNVGWILGP